MKIKQAVTIQEAKKSDAQSLAALCGELGYPANAADIEHRLEVLCSEPEHAIFVAKDDAVLGWIHVTLIHSLESDAFAEIRGLVVTEQHRGAGIGTRLVEAAEKWADGKKCDRIRVRTNIVRAEAHAFYRRLGYVSKKNQNIFDKLLGTKT
jgi:GNAT superfamily N-acetyltransferase